MNTTTKDSINAIIFVILYFSFIIFISLFKGINLYNIKIHNIYIKHIFIKIDKKLILNINDLNVYTQNSHYNKRVMKLHKVIYYSTKILPIFKEIKITNIKQNNKILFDEIYITGNNFHIFSDMIFTIGNLKIDKHSIKAFLKELRINDYLLENLKLTGSIKADYSIFQIDGYFNNYPIKAKFLIKNQTITNKIYFKNLKIKINDYKINIKKCKIKGNIDILTAKFNENATCNYIKINNNINLIKNNKIKINNSYLILNNNQIIINYPNLEIKKLILNKNNIIYSIKDKYSIIESKEAKLNYKQFKIKGKKLAFNYNLKNNNFFLHSTNVHLKYKKNNIFSKEIIIYKNKKLIYTLNLNKFVSKIVKLKNKYINGNENYINIDDLKGTIFKFPLIIKHPLINLKNKSIKTPLISINNVKFLKNNINIKNKTINIQTFTNTLFNQNLKEILNHFKINIPLKQLNGKNKCFITAQIKNNKLLNIKYLLNSQDSYLKYKNYNFSYKRLLLKGNLNNINLTINHFIFPYKYFETIADINSSINLDKKYINSYTFLKKLNIYKYLQIKNLNEKIVIDLLNEYIFMLKNSIFINLKNNTIYFYKLKKLLKYSPFKLLITDGFSIIKILPDNIKIDLKANLKYPLILNQKKPNQIRLILNIKENNINIQNKFLKAYIKNSTKLKANLSNVDISIPGLINTINTTQKIIKLISNKTNNDNNFTAKINSINTNFIYKNHKFLTQKASLQYDKEIHFQAYYKKSFLKGYTKNNYLLLEGINYNKESLLPLLDFFKHFYNINLDFVMVKSPDDFYTGKIYIKKGSVKDLKVLNNIVAFINTIPSILSLQTPGFSAKGYKIKKGFINFLFYQNILYFKQINIDGDNLAFKGKGYINLDKQTIKLKIDSIIKLKLKNIPLIGKGLSYIIFGKDGYIHIKIIIKGNLDNPKVEKDLGVSIATPFNILKRILTLPFHLF